MSAGKLIKSQEPHLCLSPLFPAYPKLVFFFEVYVPLPSPPSPPQRLLPHHLLLYSSGRSGVWVDKLRDVGLKVNAQSHQLQRVSSSHGRGEGMFI